MMNVPLVRSTRAGRLRWIAVVSAVLAVPVYLGCQNEPDAPLLPQQPAQAELDYQAGRHPGQAPAQPTTSGSGLPVLVALGAGQCVPCKMMQPDLAELRENYSDAMELVYIDVWKDQAAGARYGINMIPTQIFFDPAGRELFRHEGLYRKEDILAKWEELGMPLQPNGTDTAPEAG